MNFVWRDLKSRRLKLTRGVSFEDMMRSPIIGLEDHPTDPKQKRILFIFRNYIWVAPCVMEESEILLKTLYPSSKFTKKYLRGDYEAGTPIQN